MAEWKFRRRQDGCDLCARAFDEGQRYVSALRVEDEAIAREDVCVPCWRGRDEARRAAAAGDEQAELFFWFTRHRAEKRRTLQLDLASLEALFLRLEGRTETAARELRFVLCLLLMRKRRLKLERVVRGDDGEAMLVRRPRRKDLSKVWVFDFTPERLSELKGELQEVFEGADEEPAGGDEEGDETENALAASS
jgi:hypothetical protein